MRRSYFLPVCAIQCSAVQGPISVVVITDRRVIKKNGCSTMECDSYHSTVEKGLQFDFVP